MTEFAQVPATPTPEMLDKGAMEIAMNAQRMQTAESAAAAVYRAMVRVARGMEARSGETEGLDPEGATARPEGTRPSEPAGGDVEKLREAGLTHGDIGPLWGECGGSDLTAEQWSVMHRFVRRLAALAQGNEAVQPVVAGAQPALKGALLRRLFNECEPYTECVTEDEVAAWWKFYAGSVRLALAQGRPAAPLPAQPEQRAGFGLDDEKVERLRANSLKPEEIAGDDETQHDRVDELLHWFARLANRSANPKWLEGHAFELAYYVATQSGNRNINIQAVRDKAFKEGLNVTAAERAMLERLGVATPAAAPRVPEAATPSLSERDAERYRWLRNHWLSLVAVREGPAQSIRLEAEGAIGDDDDGKLLDTAIDAAIAASKESGND